MGDIRTRLVDALCERFPRMRNGRRAEHVVDHLLSVPGLATVELPEPDYGDRWDIPSCGEFKGVESTGDSVVSVELTDEGIEADTFGEMTPLESRLLAAALLAAANAAEAAK